MINFSKIRMSRGGAWLVPLVVTLAIVGIITVAIIVILGMEPPLKEGTVIDRRFTPAHEEQYMQTHYRTEIYTETVCTGGYGDTPRSCTPQTRTRQVPYYMPAWRHVPDDWDIRLRGCEKNDEGEEKCRTSWIDVGREIHDQCEIGKFYREETACRPQ